MNVSLQNLVKICIWRHLNFTKKMRKNKNNGQQHSIH